MEIAVILDQVIKSGNIRPRTIMLIDGIGALISTLVLGVVLVGLEEYIGMPSGVLYPLAGTALVFAVYSFGCYIFLQQINAIHIRGIAFANLTYCLITAYLLGTLFDELTKFGVAYFIGELMVILYLVKVELGVASHLTNSLK